MYRIRKDKLEKFVDLVSTLSDDGKLRFTEDGLKTKFVDPAHVAMLDITLSRKAFVKYEESEEEYGLNFNVFGNFSKYYNKDDLIDFEFNDHTVEEDVSGSFEETRHEEVNVKYIELSGEIAEGFEHDTRNRLLDTAGMAVPSIPDLSYLLHFAIPNRVLSVVVNQIKEMGISTALQITNEGENKVILSDDIDSKEKGTTITATGIDIEADEDVKSLFATDYVKYISEALEDDTELSLSLKNDYPMRVEFEELDGLLTGYFLLAPRIESR